MPDIQDFETIEYWELNIASDQHSDFLADGEASHTDLLAWMDSAQGRESFEYWFAGLGSL